MIRPDVPDELWRSATAHAERLGDDFTAEVVRFLEAYLRRKPRSTFRTPGKRQPRSKGEGSFFQRANGVWVGRVELPAGPAGRRDYAEVSSIDKAKAWTKFQQLKHDIANRVDRLQTGMDVETWMRKWAAETIKPNQSPSYYKTVLATINQQIAPAIGPVMLSRLGRHHVRFLQDFVLGETGDLRTLKEKRVRHDDGTEEVVEVPKWTSRTAQVAYDKVRQSLDAAMLERPQIIRENVARLVPRPKAVDEDRVHHSTEQARRVLVTAIRRFDPYVTLWAAKYLTGTRQGELLGLEESRIDFGNLTLDISWQLQWLPLGESKKYSDDPGRFDVADWYEIRPLYLGAALVRPKNRAAHVIPMQPELAVLLKAYLHNRAPNPFGLVWVSESGTPLRAPDEAAAFYDAQAAADVPLVQGYGVRHSADNLLGGKVDEAIRSQILGRTTAAADIAGR